MKRLEKKIIISPSKTTVFRCPTGMVSFCDFSTIRSGHRLVVLGTKDPGKCGNLQSSDVHAISSAFLFKATELRLGGVVLVPIAATRWRATAESTGNERKFLRFAGSQDKEVL